LGALSKTCWDALFHKSLILFLGPVSCPKHVLLMVMTDVQVKWEV
jgi:hypothetical protein